MNPASLAVEATKVAKGKGTCSDLLLYIFVAAAVEAVLKKKENDTVLAPIYIPEGYEIPVFIILIAGAILMPVVIGMWFKTDSKNKNANWMKRYIATIILDMFLAPSIGLILMSLVTQEFFPDISPLTYMVILPIVMVVVAYYALLFMNQGIKGTMEQIKGDATEVRAAADELKKL